MAIEPSCWIPVLQGKHCILVGDQCQLAPVILSRKALEGGLGVSLLERATTLHDGVLATKLTTQYRMNDAIASWVSKEMYGGSLKSSSTVFSHLLVDSPFVMATALRLSHNSCSSIYYGAHIGFSNGILFNINQRLRKYYQ
uniref:DNA2/NAM7 helicase helicase domain-containing protein n=1 Tax=Quercus lobata TaxID=97700 RepID=A0A7N2KXH1_QUELO